MPKNPLPDDHTILAQLYTELIGLDNHGFLWQTRTDISETRTDVSELKKEVHAFLQDREETCPIAKRVKLRRAVWFGLTALICTLATAACAIYLATRGGG